MDIRLAGLVDDSIVDGPGFRLAVFTQGCPHHCPGCHNPATHDFEGGHIDTTERVITVMKANPLLDGVTLSGGEPFCQPEACAEIASAAKASGLNVWSYSGWTFEQLLEKSAHEPGVKELLGTVDVLVDGPFLLAQRTLELRFRGSKNQRLIDVPSSLAEGRAIEIKQ
ncbi:MAG: anaerobic ribonucleoside-triphosphate reductase activating protein [Clostridia bacterium]|nr:anaerobic ribonucleoside-triphosphate reductase activating protein [Clostridia bacterium]